MKKRVLVAILALAVTCFAAGCGNNASETKSQAETGGTIATEDTAGDSTTGNAEVTSELKEYTMAVSFLESGSRNLEILRTNCNILEEMSNGTIINGQLDLTPDGNLSFVESQIASGVDGLVVCPAADSVLPTITQMCEEAGVYWGITLRSITDPEIKAMVESSPYYVGNCYEDETNAGYECGKWMGEAGYKNIAIISQAKGDTTCDTRELGLLQACEEYGINIAGEARGHVQASDVAASVESFLAANKDLDAVFFVGTTAVNGTEAAVKVIQDSGRNEVKMVTIDYPQEMVSNFAGGTLVYTYATPCLTLDTFISLVKVANAIQGTPVDTDGTFSSNSISMSGIDNVEDAEAYLNVTGNSAYEFFDNEGMKKLLGWENPNLTESSLQEILDNYKPVE